LQRRMDALKGKIHKPGPFVLTPLDEVDGGRPNAVGAVRAIFARLKALIPVPIQATIANVRVVVLSWVWRNVCGNQRQSSAVTA
jgi:hypothetical protein